MLKSSSFSSLKCHSNKPFNKRQDFPRLQREGAGSLKWGIENWVAWPFIFFHIPSYLVYCTASLLFSSLRQLYLFLGVIVSWTVQSDGTLGFSIWKFAHSLNHEGDIDFIRGTTEDTSTVYWATPAQGAGRWWAHLTELNFEGLHYTISHFLLETQETCPQMLRCPCLSGYKHCQSWQGNSPQRSLSRHGFAQILPLVLPKFVAKC